VGESAFVFLHKICFFFVVIQQIKPKEIDVCFSLLPAKVNLKQF
jgi:hypothetical protein